MLPYNRPMPFEPGFEPVLRAAELRAVEARAAGQPLMERAGLAAATVARTILAGRDPRVLVLAGPGQQWRRCLCRRTLDSLLVNRRGTCLSRRSGAAAARRRAGTSSMDRGRWHRRQRMARRCNARSQWRPWTRTDRRRHFRTRSRAADRRRVRGVGNSRQRASRPHPFARYPQRPRRRHGRCARTHRTRGSNGHVHRA